ncbi:MAG: hypothetical protein KKD28_10640 [Chloroflexi bacterium]|nr:hypothetical protein [Chloroflexota bacterium]MBU1661913.1 hypothetical protein [Chloroflexota bacterium]
MQPDDLLEREVEQNKDLPEYKPPQVLTFRGDEILDLLGPAQACSFNHSVVLCGDTSDQWQPSDLP